MSIRLKRPSSLQMLNSLLVSLNMFIVGSLWITSYLHQNNNHGIRPDQYSIRTISPAGFRALSADHQMYWSRVEGSDSYTSVTIDNSFVSAQKNVYLWGVLPLTVLAMVLSYIALRKEKGPDAQESSHAVPVVSPAAT